ncbi:MAG: YicC family protein [Chlamydiae bacterium]|nr:YicC family protein [Chlamydiota bacterium]
MLKSMSGFGRSSISLEKGELLIEIQSVNRKFLEFTFFVPKEFFGIESDLKKWIGEKVSRGSLNIRISFHPKELTSFLFDPKLLKKTKLEMEKLAKELGFDKKEVNLKFLIDYVIEFAEANKSSFESIKPFIKKEVEKAIDDLLSMKIKEGKVLAADIQKRLGFIQKELLAIEKLAPQALADYKEKSESSIKEFVPENIEAGEKILRSLTVFAKIFSERVDITEEIVRLKSHIKQFQELLTSQDVVGRKMEFLLQEMHRESNTISSKAQEIKILSRNLEIKNEIEKIKEQVQNIE